MWFQYVSLLIDHPVHLLSIDTTATAIAKRALGQ